MGWSGTAATCSSRTCARPYEADQADEVLGIADIQVAAIVAVHGTKILWGALRADGVTVVAARRLPDLLRRCRLSLGRNGWPGWPTAPGTVPIRRLTGRTSWRCKRYCWRGLISGAQ
jgi:hypothetical protein